MDSTGVEHTPRKQEVMGSDHAGLYLSFSLFYFLISVSYKVRCNSNLTSPNFQISEQHIALDTLVRGV